MGIGIYQQLTIQKSNKTNSKGGVYDEEEYNQIVAAQKKIREELRRVKELCEQVYQIFLSFFLLFPPI